MTIPAMRWMLYIAGGFVVVTFSIGRRNEVTAAPLDEPSPPVRLESAEKVIGPADRPNANPITGVARAASISVVRVGYHEANTNIQT